VAFGPMCYSEGGIEMDEAVFWIKLAAWVIAAIGFWRACRTQRLASPQGLVKTWASDLLGYNCR
jgi:hypothetical protein